MTVEHEVSAADTVRWLHEDGLRRLAALGRQLPDTAATYTVQISTGDITTYPVNGGGGLTLGADDLPPPLASAGRLLVAGVMTNRSVLVLDLATTLAMGINAAEPAGILRSWAVQLLLNREITVATNSSAIDLDVGSRFRRIFIPGNKATILTVDDGHPPITTVSVDSESEGADYLEMAADSTGRLHFAGRPWLLWRVLTVDDGAWTRLAAALALNNTPARKPENTT